MALDHDVHSLLLCDFFQSFSPSHLRLLCFGCDKISLEKDQVLYKSGEDATVAYVLLTGGIDLLCDIQKKTVNLATIKPVAILGELALIKETNRFETAVASEQSSLIMIQKRYFLRILQEHPEVIPIIQKKIQDNIRMMSACIQESLSFFDS